MKLEKRIEKIEAKFNIKHGCVLLITVWDGTEGPTKEQSDQYLKNQKESGQCENCGGICILDWTEKPPKIWKQQSLKGGRGMSVEDNKQHDWSFVIGKGYQELGNQEGKGNGFSSEIKAN